VARIKSKSTERVRMKSTNVGGGCGVILFDMAIDSSREEMKYETSSPDSPARQHDLRSLVCEQKKGTFAVSCPGESSNCPRVK